MLGFAHIIPAGISEEVLDERRHQFDPQLDVAVGALERGAGHLCGPPVQHLLFLTGHTVDRTAGSVYTPFSTLGRAEVYYRPVKNHLHNHLITNDLR